jgi:hypothetical protein
MHRVLGAKPSIDELDSYLEAYFGDRLSNDERSDVLSTLETSGGQSPAGWFGKVSAFLGSLFGNNDLTSDIHPKTSEVVSIRNEAISVANLLIKSTEEMDSVLEGLDGGFVKPAPGGGEHFILFVRAKDRYALSHLELHLFQIYFVTAQTSYQREETSTRSILTECLALVLGSEARAPQERFFDSIKPPMMGVTPRLWPSHYGAWMQSRQEEKAWLLCWRSLERSQSKKGLAALFGMICYFWRSLVVLESMFLRRLVVYSGELPQPSDLCSLVAGLSDKQSFTGTRLQTSSTCWTTCLNDAPMPMSRNT